MNAGNELIIAGWRQGSIFRPGPAKIPFLVREGQSWDVASELLTESHRLVISSQSCDLARDAGREPFVEALRAHETNDKNILYAAKGRSTRYYLLREPEQGLPLIACASYRLLLEKRSLVGLTPEFTITGSAADSFRVFLARRDARPALEDRLAHGVQRPIVDAVKRCLKHDRLRVVLDGIREFMFRELEDGGVEVLLVREDNVTFHQADLGEVYGYVVEAVKDRGIITAIKVDHLSLDAITARDYQLYLPLPLEEFSKTESSSAAAAVERHPERTVEE
jgi:hypothetical protein